MVSRSGVYRRTWERTKQNVAAVRFARRPWELLRPAARQSAPARRRLGFATAATTQLRANCRPAQLQALTDFGYHVGLAFQVIDDILDVTQTSEQLGKTAGKDTKAQKATYPAIVGLEKSRRIAGQLTQRAFAALKIFQGRAVALEALAEFLLQRDR